MNGETDYIQWLITGGAVIVAGWFSSWLLDDFAWWNALQAKVKKLLILLLSLIVAYIAYAYQQQPGDVRAIYDPYLGVFFTTVVVWLSTQVAHKVDK